MRKAVGKTSEQSLTKNVQEKQIAGQVIPASKAHTRSIFDSMCIFPGEVADLPTKMTEC